MTKNRWRSVDAHFHDRAVRLLQSVSPIEAAKNSFLTNYNLSEVWSPRMHDHKLLTLRWRSFPWWGKDGIAMCFAYKGCQKCHSDWLQPIGGVISQDTWPHIVDSLLTLNLMLGQGGYCNLFCLERQPKIPLWLATTKWRCDFPRHMTTNCWRTVDAHFHDGAGRVLQSVLPIKAVYNSFMTGYNLSQVWFPRTNDQKSLTLHWRSVDAHFAIAVSILRNHVIWQTPSFTLLSIPIWCFHLLSFWSLLCSLTIHRYIY
jgi:hypothetical protein